MKKLFPVIMIIFALSPVLTQAKSHKRIRLEMQKINSMKFKLVEVKQMMQVNRTPVGIKAGSKGIFKFEIFLSKKGLIRKCIQTLKKNTDFRFKRISFYSKNGNIIYSFMFLESNGMETLHISRNIYWKNRKPHIAHQAIATIKMSSTGNPINKVVRNKLENIKIDSYFRSTNELSKNLNLIKKKPDIYSSYTFKMMKNESVLLNSNGVSIRNKPHKSARRLGLLDITDPLIVLKKGPSQYISGFGRHHWYQINTVSNSSVQLGWVFGAFLEFGTVGIIE